MMRRTKKTTRFFIQPSTWKQWERQCKGKIKHQTMTAAQAHAEGLTKKMNKEYRAYECHFCGKYHVGGAHVPPVLSAPAQHAGAGNEGGPGPGSTASPVPSGQAHGEHSLQPSR